MPLIIAGVEMSGRSRLRRPSAGGSERRQSDFPKLLTGARRVEGTGCSGGKVPLKNYSTGLTYKQGQEDGGNADRREPGRPYATDGKKGPLARLPGDWEMVKHGDAWGFKAGNGGGNRTTRGQRAGTAVVLDGDSENTQDTLIRLLCHSPKKKESKR